MKTLAETICELSREHCRAGGLIMGQNLEAVQNVCDTVPIDEANVTIMPTCESSGIGMAIGAALSGRPVIHVIRFASFLWMQAQPLVYYAARAKSQWGYDLPLFVRASSDDGLGPTHSGVYHSPFVHMPGLKVVAPMTPGEYMQVWQEFQEIKQPVLVSEHRQSYENFLEMPFTSNHTEEFDDVLIVGISATRFAIRDALDVLRLNGIRASSLPIVNLTDSLSVDLIMRARSAMNVIIADSGYVPCSVSEHIALQLYNCIKNEELNVEILGMKEPPHVNTNSSPTASEIVETAILMCH